MSLVKRLERIEGLVSAQYAPPDATTLIRQALRRLRATLPDDEAATIELTAALFKCVAARLPADALQFDDPYALALTPEDRAALATWRERCDGPEWPSLGPADPDGDQIAAAFLWDWHTHLRMVCEWKRLGNLEKDSPEHVLYFDTAQRGHALWCWGGWTMLGLPPDWCELTPNPTFLKAIAGPIAAALIAVAEP